MSTQSYTQRLHPQMKAVLEKQAEVVPNAKKVHELSPSDARRQYLTGRRYWNADAPAVDEVIESSVAGPAGDIPVRVYLPGDVRPLPALVYIHGGGWLVGNLDSHDKIMRLLALRSGAAVVGVDYRLAPEHKFPTALDECRAVVAHLRDHGTDWGIDPQRLAIGGDSAGANLSMAVALSLRDTEPDRLALLVLVYGVFGLSDSTSRRLFGERGDALTNKEMDYYYDCYVRGPEDRHDHRVDVLAADLRGLPPAFISAAAIDLLLDDSIAMKVRMDEAGVPTRLEIYDGVLHGFLHYSRTLDAASEAIDDAAQAIREAFAHEPA
ncbi:MAG: alpha/beta hydrolase fold domain-containing protein [Gammaproteobacteria bacterium]|nr:alpha/beta hydrolase fold domain-containing protein [Gammaproteobacteria bacterium]NIR23059.1 alpha/beta hydrolase fold domain-containing protein [Gammaproteobacteria bacterium]NIS04332.1 alpha/beta hydrolase fold domain-containing protein [Gammaproteobacteria bacterium]NIV46515.1 alpha/beta hydrolase fold domain-containing protein [Gammaproteobacteria bacterium]NIW54622.1 alpha/beta hydrolase fold domain-containing protein [Gammaproteobacteria bacterium]